MISFDVSSVGGICVTISILIFLSPNIFDYINKKWKIKCVYFVISKTCKIILIISACVMFIIGVIISLNFNLTHQQAISKQDNECLNDENKANLAPIQIQNIYFQNYEIVKNPILNVDFDTDTDTDSFRIINYVRLKGMDEWVKEIDAEVGDIVEFQIEYKNTSQKTIKDVMLLDSLPNGLMYIKDSTILKNANYSQGVSITSDNISSIVDKGINIGSYTDKSNAFIRFEAIVVDKGYKGLDSVKMTNWAKITSGSNTKISSSKIIVNIN